MAAHFSILAWRIPWTEEPGRLQSMGKELDMTERLTLSLLNIGWACVIPLLTIEGLECYVFTSPYIFVMQVCYR